MRPPAQPLVARAPAKINLTLHVVGRRPDGYHELESLVAFSRSGDSLSLWPGPALKFSLEGPSAVASGDPARNLVTKAALALAERVDALQLGAFHLIKRLPVAAGIGGGSSDAAAALRLLAGLNGLALDDARVMDAALACGADVPVCLAARARMMTGIGERLGPLLTLPPLPALIVNPGQPLETKAVFARMNPSRDTRPASARIRTLRRGSISRRCRPACARAATTWKTLPACWRRSSPMSSPFCRQRRAVNWPGCRARARPVLPCLPIAVASRGRKKSILAAHPHWWVKATILN